jgi:glutamate-1-semialdehyde 2,1-aminomutase
MIDANLVVRIGGSVMDVYKFDKSYAMYEEAKKVVPGGIYGPRTPVSMTYGSYPCFLSKGKGSHIWDVDGNEYVDYMCSFGTNIVGLCNEEVNAAAIAQMALGDAFTLPSDRWNEMAEYLVGLVKGADWTVFGKNGSDVTTYAMAVACAYTGKQKVIMASGAYHGAHFWCSHNAGAIPAEYSAHTLEFEFGNIEQLKRIVEANKGNVAAIVLTPYHHPAVGDQVMPSPSFYKELKEICQREGIVHIMDDIRAGFRLNPHGSHVHFDADPDLICFGKAMSNGYPISAVTGKEALRTASTSVFFTGTHFFSAVPMAAAMACMKIIERDGITQKLEVLGSKMKKGMVEQAAGYGLKVSYTGPPAIPYMRFVDDADFSINRFFCGEACKRGIFLHPHHNWFLSGAHTEEDIDRTLQVTEECFRLVRDGYSNAE